MTVVVGKEFAGYRIVDVLGKGGMGTVYKAEDPALGRFVAIKMLDPALARDASFLRRFKSEARALARLNDRNIVGIFAMPATEEGQCIVMEYVDGPTLSEVIRARGAMPWQEAVPILIQFMTAIERAHEAGIVHRDIKPSNVMLTGTGVVKVTDFGLAKLEEPGDATKTQGMAGTLYYMSPEQVKGLANVDARSDIYSAGMTLYEILAGRVPFEQGMGEFAILKAIVEDRFAPPSQYAPSLPKPLSRIIQKAIEKDPAKRYQSAAEMRKALESVAVDTGDTVADRRGASGVHAQPAAPVRRGWLYGAFALVLVAVAVWGGLRIFGTAADAPATTELAAGESDVQTESSTPVDGEMAVLDAGSSPGFTDAPVAPSNGGATTPATQARVPSPEPQVPAGGQTTTPPRPLAAVVVRAGAGGTVAVNGKSQGAGGSVALPAGRYPVLCRHTASATSAETWVEVAAGEEKTVQCFVEQQLAVGVTEASGARTWASVWINDEMAGSTPLLRTLVPGTYRISVQRDGYAATEAARTIVVAPAFEEKTHRIMFTIKAQ